MPKTRDGKLIVQIAEEMAEEISRLRTCLIAMVYVHPCNCADIIGQHCARCRAVAQLGFDPAVIDE